jgi:L-seryl-tRNA(Ser) seleniumtransferase
VTGPGQQGIYARLGLRTYVDLTATESIHGGAPMLPEVRRAMAEAADGSVVIDELMARVGERIAGLLGVPSALVTSGAAGALTAATCACVAGGDPERAVQLPDLDGMRDQVVMPVQSRTVFDQTIRAVGVRLVEVDSAAELRAAVGPRTALLAMWAGAAAAQTVTVDELVAAGRRHGAPVVIDAAAELPAVPNRWLAAGADLVCYSGGKILQGPQGAGLLLGREDLVQAAWMHCAPHGTFGRMMKVSKEEIAGMLAAIEYLTGGRDLDAEFERWRGWYRQIAEALAAVDGVRTEVRESGGRSPYPILIVSWDPRRVPLTAGQMGAALRAGSPPILSHAEGSGCEFMIRPVSMVDGDAEAAAHRLAEILGAPPQQRPSAPPAAGIDGEWEVEVRFVAGFALHRFSLVVAQDRIDGRHRGTRAEGELSGRVDGDAVVLDSVLAAEGARLTYRFTGAVDAAAGTMYGTLRLGEQLVDGFGAGAATWAARRVGSGA